MKYDNLIQRKDKLNFENSLVDLYLKCDTLAEFEKKCLEIYGYVSYSLDPFHRAYWRKRYPIRYYLVLNSMIVMLSVCFGFFAPIMFLVLHLVNIHVGERIMSRIEWNENGRPIDY